MKVLKFTQKLSLLKLALLAIFTSLNTLLFSQFAQTKTYHKEPSTEKNRNIDVSKMCVDVSFNPIEKTVFGKVTHTFTALQSKIDTIFLNAPGIRIHSVRMDKKELLFKSNNDGVIIYPELKNAFQNEYQIEINYTAHPKKGIYFIGWELDSIEMPEHMTRKQIWTQGQGIDNRHWIPMVDDRSDKFITETTVTFNDKYKVLSNGKLEKVKHNKNEGTKTWIYKMDKPHAGYLLMLAIGEYDIKKSTSANGVPMQFWYYPEHPERLEPTSRYSEEILDFLADEIGVPYPWGTYSQVMVQDFLYGAMENTSATTFGDFFWVDSRAYLLNRNYVSVNAHEATHQWFGDLITGRRDNEQWLQESFATFYPGLMEGHIFSKDHESWYFHGQRNSAFNAGKANSLPVRHSKSGSSRHYPKGASVLYMLQHQIGRENFRRGIQHYLNQYQYKTVETWDLQKAFIDAVGINVDEFFDQWIHRGGEPIFDVTVDVTPEKCIYHIKQTQEIDPVVGYFNTPVDIAVYYTDSSIHRETIQVNGPYTRYEVPRKENTDVLFALFDEGEYLLKDLNFDKPLTWDVEQLLRAEHMLDRYQAAVNLRNAPIPVKYDALLTAWENETFPQMRAEIASQLLSPSMGEYRLNTPIQNFITDKDAEVRLVAATLIDLTEDNAELAMSLLSDSSYVIINTIFDRIFHHPVFQSKQSQILDLIKDVNGFTHDVKVKYLENAIYVYPDMANGFRNALIRMAGPEYEFRTRILAAQALQRQNFLDERFAHNLFEGYISFNSRLAGPYADILRYYSKQTKYVISLAFWHNTFVRSRNISIESKNKLQNLMSRL